MFGGCVACFEIGYVLKLSASRVILRRGKVRVLAFELLHLLFDVELSQSCRPAQRRVGIGAERYDLIVELIPKFSRLADLLFKILGCQLGSALAILRFWKVGILATKLSHLLIKLELPQSGIAFIE